MESKNKRLLGKGNITCQGLQVKRVLRKTKINAVTVQSLNRNWHEMWLGIQTAAFAGKVLKGFTRSLNNCLRPTKGHSMTGGLMTYILFRLNFV